MSEQPPQPPPPPGAIANPAARPTDGGALAAFVLGLISPFGALFYGLPGVIMGSVAVFLGLRARGRIKRSGGTLGGGGMALAGWIVGLVGIVIGLAWGLFLLALYAAMVSTSPGK
ncbi:MAG TPA: hypothetical protein VLK30_04870 [Candidatus Limnocylindrales bacterium]|nr:hypothetical protein [Candidatus Limnocylindrales bacterium]